VVPIAACLTAVPVLDSAKRGLERDPDYRPCRIVLDSDDYPHVVPGHVRQYPDWYSVHRSDFPGRYRYGVDWSEAVGSTLIYTLV